MWGMAHPLAGAAIGFGVFEVDPPSLREYLLIAASTKSDAATAGIGAGSALAMILSFQLNHSILWAMLHGVCSWIYIGYRAYQGNY